MSQSEFAGVVIYDGSLNQLFEHLTCLDSVSVTLSASLAELPQGTMIIRISHAVVLPDIHKPSCHVSGCPEWLAQSHLGRTRSPTSIADGDIVDLVPNHHVCKATDAETLHLTNQATFPESVLTFTPSIPWRHALLLADRSLRENHFLDRCAALFTLCCFHDSL